MQISGISIMLADEREISFRGLYPERERRGGKNSIESIIVHGSSRSEGLIVTPFFFFFFFFFLLHPFASPS